MSFELRSQKYKVVAVLKKSQASAIKEIEQGDIIQLSFVAKSPGRGSRNSLYVPSIKIINLTTGKETYERLTRVDKHLSYFDLKEL